MRKKRTKEALRDPHPVVTFVIGPDGGVLSAGLDRERLAQDAASQGWENFEMKDIALVV